MPRMLDTQNPSPFPRNTAADVSSNMGDFMNQMLPLVEKYKNYQQSQMPLGDYLGNIPQSALPPGLQQFWSTPIGKLSGLQQALGGSLTGLIKPKSDSVNTFFDPATGTFGIGDAPEGATAIPLKPAEAAKALKKPTQTGPSTEDVGKLADMVQKSQSPGKAYGNLPGFGPNSVKSKVAAELAHRGADIGKMSLDAEAQVSYTKTINSPSFQNTLKYLTSVEPNMDRVIKLSDKISRTFAKPLNRAQLTVMVNSGDKDVAAFGAAAIEVADQVAKILQGGGTGSATSDAKLAQANALFDSAFTPQQLKAVAETLRGMLSERRNALQTMTMQTISGQTPPKKPLQEAFNDIQRKNPKLPRIEIFKMLHKQGY